MNGSQCDTCRKFASFPPPGGWLMLLQQEPPAPPSVFSLISGGAELTGTFCGLRCLAEWAYAKLATEGLQGGGHGAEGWLG